MLSRLSCISKFSLYNSLTVSNPFRTKSALFRPSLAIRLFGHGNNILENENFMSTYYDATPVPKESELDPEEFQTRMESWYRFPCNADSIGHRIRCLLEWKCAKTEIGTRFTKILWMVGSIICLLTVGPHETSVKKKKKWDDLCYSSEKEVVLFLILL